MRDPVDVVLEDEDTWERGYDGERCDIRYSITLADALEYDDFNSETYGFTHDLRDLEILREDGTLDLSGRDLQDVDFAGQSLAGANFRGANLRGASFRGATLEGADFRGADLMAADLTGAELGDAQFDPNQKKEAA